MSLREDYDIPPVGWQPNYNYTDLVPTNDGKKSPADIVGPISRADERQLRQVIYFRDTGAYVAGVLTLGNTVTFDTLYQIYPDFWVVRLFSGSASTLTVQQESQDKLTINIAGGTSPYKMAFPGVGRSISFTAGLANVPLLAAAVWGYNPNDVL